MVRELIKRDTILKEAIEEYPEIVSILIGYGLHCVGCYFSEIETIEQGAKTHGLTKEVIEMMLKDVNSIVLENKVEK